MFEMARSDAWQAWRLVKDSRERLERHLEQCPEYQRWSGRHRVWIQPGRVTPLPLCEQGTRLAQAWQGEPRRARARRGGSTPKAS
jgi:hypothetical protein